METMWCYYHVAILSKLNKTKESKKKKNKRIFAYEEVMNLAVAAIRAMDFDGEWRFSQAKWSAQHFVTFGLALLHYYADDHLYILSRWGLLNGKFHRVARIYPSD